MKPRSTVTALLAITASLLAARTGAARTKRMTSAGSAVSFQAVSTLKSSRKPRSPRLKTQPSS